MKNALLLGLLAAVLFTASAGLSLWLNQPKAKDEAPAAKATGRKSASSDEKHAPPKAIIAPRPSELPADLATMTNQLTKDRETVNKRQEELEHQEELHRFAVEDIRQEMELLRKQMQQLGTESKQGVAKPGEPGAELVLPPSLPKSATPTPDLSAPTDTNAKGLTAGKNVLEAMTPENAAKHIEGLARTGKIDTVVQLLSKMTPRQSAKIFAQIGDEKLSNQLMDKLIEARPPPAPAKAP